MNKIAQHFIYSTFIFSPSLHAATTEQEPSQQHLFSNLGSQEQASFIYPNEHQTLFIDNTSTFGLAAVNSSQVEQQLQEANEADVNSLIEKDWWGALAEIGTILLLGEVLYQVGESTMEKDFDYDVEGGALEYFHDRLFTKKYWKLDDNAMSMNWGHAFAGALYYQAFRNYNFNYYESTLAAFLTSTTWEVFVEYQEAVSINDQIVTTWGGSVLGESYFQMAEMLAHKEGWVPTTFEMLFNPSQVARGWFDAQSKPRFNRSKVVDDLSVYTGAMHSSNDTRDLDKSILTLGLDASINSMKGNYDSLWGTPTWVEVSMEMGLSEAGVEDWQMSNKLLLGGYNNWINQDDLNPEAWQQHYFIGPATGVEYASFGEEDDEDFYAVVNLLGVTMGGEWQQNQLSLSIRGDIYGDFAMVKPFATQGLENYRATFWNSKSALWENGYAYALGHTLNLEFEAKYRDIAFGLLAKSHRWDSIDNKKIERFTDWNPNRKDLDFKDERDRYQAYLKYAISKQWTLGLHYEEIHRSGEFFGIDFPDFYAQADDVESRSWLQLDYIY